MSDRALKYVDKFGSEKLKYQTLAEAVSHYRDLKRILIPDIGVAKVTRYSGNELNRLIRNEGMKTVPDYTDDSITGSNKEKSKMIIDDDDLLKERTPQEIAKRYGISDKTVKAL